MRGESAMEYIMTYGWAILIIIIVAAALFALGVFDPHTYAPPASDNARNCTDFFAPAKVIYAVDVAYSQAVQHKDFDSDNDFLENLRGEDVWVYCWRDMGAVKCGAFNSLGVFHWNRANCNMQG
jgi:hypothetical protein